MFIFAAAFQQNAVIMSPPAVGNASLQAAPAPAPAPAQQPAAPAAPVVEKPKKKFQVVPVPGEFTRGRWKVIDTRFGSAMGEFGNYPPDDEYKMIVTCKNNVITVRNKIPPIEERLAAANNIRVLEKSQPRIDQPQPPSTLPINQISIVIMDADATQALAESGRISVAETVDLVVNNSDDSMTNPSSTATTVTVITNEDAPGMTDSQELATATSNTVVAIDNKIVQAMDLVKTHLTFAVREEVETLRTTITDLESRLNALREENRLLRENVAPDVLALITSANKQISDN